MPHSVYLFIPLSMINLDDRTTIRKKKKRDKEEEEARLD